jgi:hypothetical protein
MRFKGWFGRKAVGYGIGPRSWQGWLVSVIAVAAILGHRWFHPVQFGLPPWTRPALAIAIGMAFLLVMWLTYDDEV